MAMEDIVLGVSHVALVITGLLFLVSAGYERIQRCLFWASTWKQRHRGRRQYAARGWNTVPEDIPEDRQVAAVWESWRPEICVRRGDRLVSPGINFNLDGCTGWLELPELNAPNTDEEER